MANLDTALENTRSTAPSTTVQGHRFERMFRAALLAPPGTVIRSTAPSITLQGRQFERMMKTAIFNRPGKSRNKFGPDIGIGVELWLCPTLALEDAPPTVFPKRHRTPLLGGHPTDKSRKGRRK